MLNTRPGKVRAETVLNHDYLVVGSRVNNATTKKYYQVEYPQDIH